MESRLIAQLDDPDFDVRFAAIFALGDRGDPAGIEPLENLRKTGDIPSGEGPIIERQIARIKNPAAAQQRDGGAHRRRHPPPHLAHPPALRRACLRSRTPERRATEWPCGWVSGEPADRRAAGQNRAESRGDEREAKENRAAAKPRHALISKDDRRQLPPPNPLRLPPFIPLPPAEFSGRADYCRWDRFPPRPPVRERSCRSRCERQTRADQAPPPARVPA